MPSKYYKQTYEEFAADPAPLKLAKELAEIRTLANMMWDSIDQARSSSVLAFQEALTSSISTFIQYQIYPRLKTCVTEALVEAGMEEIDVAGILPYLASAFESARRDKEGDLALTISQEWLLSFGNHLRHITMEEAQGMLKIYQGVGVVAEKMKKVEDGLTIKIEYGHEILDILGTLVVQIILPYVPPSLRGACAEKARDMLPLLIYKNMPQLKGVEVING